MRGKRETTSSTGSAECIIAGTIPAKSKNTIGVNGIASAIESMIAATTRSQKPAYNTLGPTAGAHVCIVPGSRHTVDGTAAASPSPAGTIDGAATLAALTPAGWPQAVQNAAPSNNVAPHLEQYIRRSCR